MAEHDDHDVVGGGGGGLPLICEIRLLDGHSVGVLVLTPKVFSSGKVGWFGQSKIMLEDARYQAQCQLVQIASKDDPS